MDMHKAAEEVARMQQELLTEVRQEAQRAVPESANEQMVRMQQATDVVSQQHEHALALQAEEAARHDQQLRELQRVAEEQRHQLGQVAQDQRALEQQVVESRSVVQAAFEAVDGRTMEEPEQPSTTRCNVGPVRQPSSSVPVRTV
ncbi:hypothetical protein CYMTET_32184 [Cymbomonas tetramitiformis]|uniref:Uncharacterized protein n=1 Tax=Cymbomonas tetramitiformis TaxID=36881 RepID=A0AAE0FFH8_9CHLO|nr:hypothetical protein CYMTET_32184 [Cymbomonas tetramitiformis]